MCKGAKFQIFLASLLNVDWDRFVLAVSGTISAAVVLVSLSSSCVDFIPHFIGYSGSWLIFHASVNFIWAFIWLTDSIFSLVRIDLVLILSLICVPFRNLVSLFCISWVFFSQDWVSSESVSLTLPSSCNPYLIFELKRLSAIFLRASLFTHFLSLFTRNSIQVIGFQMVIVHSRLNPSWTTFLAYQIHCLYVWILVRISDPHCILLSPVGSYIGQGQDSPSSTITVFSTSRVFHWKSNSQRLR